MSVNTAFSPAQGQNRNLSATDVSQALTGFGKGANQVRVTVKAGGGDLYIYSYATGTPSSVRAATTADYCVVAGQSSTFTKGAGNDAIAYITDATLTAAFKIIPGEGM